MAEPLVVLAPLAEVTDAAFRAVAFDAGADAATTEMVSAAGLVRGSRNTPPLLERLPEERGRPLSAQLYGHDPAELAEAARIVAGLGRFAAVDLNAGCPMRRIVANGDGAALMRDPALLGRCVAAMVRAAAPLPVTVKTRIGTDPEHPAAAELAHVCEDAGAALLAVHGRYESQAHAGIIGQVGGDVVLGKLNLAVLHVLGMDKFNLVDEAQFLEHHRACQTVEVASGDEASKLFFHMLNLL